MVAFKPLIVVFSGLAAVSALVVPRKSPPSGWWTEGMEDYQAYHARYIALGCQNQHGQPFFDLCCHPLKRDETLETARAPECVPTYSSIISACLAEPTSTATTPDDQSSSPASTTVSDSVPTPSSDVSTPDPTTSAAATPSPISNVATGNDDNDDGEDDGTCDADEEDVDDGDDEDDEEFCDEEDEEEDEGDDEICEEDDGDEDGDTSALPVSTAAPEPTTTTAPTSTPTETDGDDEGDDDGEDCEEDGGQDEDTTAFVPTSSVEPSSTESISLEPTSGPAETSTPDLPTSSVAPETSSPESTPEATSFEAPGPTSTDAPSPTEIPSSSIDESPSTPPETTSEVFTPESSPAAEPTQSSDSSSEVITGGFATFYTQNGNKGACGDAHQDSDFIAAMDSRRYGDTSQRSELCGRQVKITNTQNGKEVTVTIADACPSCENENSIDLSTGAFDQIATREEGMVPISWKFV